MKNPYFKLSLSAIFLSLLILANGCKKTDSTTVATTIPVLTSDDLIINLTSTTAQSGGSISNAGNALITANGVCYSATNKTPTTSDPKTTDAVTNGVYPINFTSNLSALTANTVYYLRAYATNSAGTGYGNVVKFTTSSNVSSVLGTVTTFAGSGVVGSTNGSGLGATFNNPQGIAVDASGKLYVSDSYNSLIRQVTPAGLVSTFAGNGAIGYNDGAGLSAQFYGPRGLTIDAQGNTYVADLGNNVIRKITPAGIVSTYAGSGTPGFHNYPTPLVAEFRNPAAVAVDGSGNLYIADRGNNAIRKITAAGYVSTLAGSAYGIAGYTNAVDSAALFNGPSGIAVDASGNVYVADQGNSAIRKISTAGVVTTVAGGTAQRDLLNYPSALALDKQGNIYIADEYGRVLEATTTGVLYILAGAVNTPGFVNGLGTAALFNDPQGIAVDANGIIYVADQNNNTIRKITVTTAQ